MTTEDGRVYAGPDTCADSGPAALRALRGRRLYVSGLTVSIVVLFAAATVRGFTLPGSRQVESLQAARVNVIVPIIDG